MNQTQCSLLFSGPLLLCVLLSLVAVFSTTPSTAAALDTNDGSGDDYGYYRNNNNKEDNDADGQDEGRNAAPERQYVDRMDGHLAHYITMSKITFNDQQEAQAALDDIKSGARNFMNVANEQAVNNARVGRQNAARQNGDLGLVTYDLIEEELAEVAFDIRQPIAKGTGDILGPVCTSSGCSIMAVFARFRRSFFSRAWFEAEQYCKDNDQQMSDIISRLDTDEMAMVAGVVWPDEHVTYRKIKLRELKGDLKKLNQVDPSTVFKPDHMSQGQKRDLSEHNRLMREREAIFKVAGPAVLERNPEIYAMSIPQMKASGLIPAEAFAVGAEEVAKADKEEKEATDALHEKVEMVDKYKMRMRKPKPTEDAAAAPVLPSPPAECSGGDQSQEEEGASSCARSKNSAAEKEL